MELLINNFTEKGNGLKWRSSWESYQRKNCKSKTMVKMENGIHYNRIINALTDNRSIDVLNEASLKNVKKMTESKQKGNSNRIDIALNGKTVGIVSELNGVVATENTLNIGGITSMRRNLETGEVGMTIWDDDYQAPVKDFTFDAGSGDRITEFPGQFSVPSSLPPRMRPVVYDSLGLPDTNSQYVPRNYVQERGDAVREILLRNDDPRLRDFYSTPQFLNDEPSVMERQAQQRTNEIFGRPGRSGIIALPSSESDVQNYLSGG